MTQPPPASIVLSPTALIFGGAMLVLGVVIGWLAHPGPPAAIDAPAVVHEAPSASDEAPKKKAGGQPQLPPERDPGPPPADSPFVAKSILDQFDDEEHEAAYLRAVSFLAQGDARGGLRGIVRLESASLGQPWREPALILVIEARAAVGEIGATRYAARVFRQEFPDSAFRPRVTLAEARTFLQQAKRYREGAGVKDGPSRAVKAEGQALILLDRLQAEDPESPEAGLALELTRSLRP